MVGSPTQFPARFPADVWGAVAEYASETPQHALLAVALVHPEARMGVEACDRLWYRFVRARWPNAKPRAGTFTAFRARCRAALAAGPIPASELHPIERCHVEFACPYFAEGKGIRLVEGGSDPELENDGLPVYYCGICNDHVFTVASQEALDARVEERRCVVIPKEIASVRPDTYSGTAEVVVCATEEDVARHFVRSMKVEMMKRINGKVSIVGSPLNNLLSPRNHGNVSVEGDNFIWERHRAPTVRIRAFWSAARRLDATAPQTSLLLVVTNDRKTEKMWQWPRGAIVRQEYNEKNAKREHYESAPLYKGRIEPTESPEQAVDLLHDHFPLECRATAGIMRGSRQRTVGEVIGDAVAEAAKTKELLLEGFRTGDWSKPAPIPLTIGTTLPESLAGSLTSLHVNKILYWDALDGQLIAAMPGLEKLRIESCDEFKSIPVEVFTSLPRLEELVLNDLPELRELTDVRSNTDAMQSLVVLDLQRCDIRRFDAGTFLSSPGAPSLRKLLLAQNPGLQMSFPPIKELTTAAPKLMEVSLDNRPDLIWEARLGWGEPHQHCNLSVVWGTDFPHSIGDRLFLGTAAHTKHEAQGFKTLPHIGISGYLLAARGLECNSRSTGIPWLALPIDDCPEAELVSHFRQACQFLDRMLRNTSGSVLVCGDGAHDARGLAVVVAYRMWQSRPNVKTAAEVVDELPPAEVTSYPVMTPYVVEALNAFHFFLMSEL